MPSFISGPLVVCLCGSTRFREMFENVAREETLAGNIVVGPGVFAHSGDSITDEEKERLNELHFRKIEMADSVVIISPNGYIGTSTRQEIEYAESLHKPIVYIGRNQHVDLSELLELQYTIRLKWRESRSTDTYSNALGEAIIDLQAFVADCINLQRKSVQAEVSMTDEELLGQFICENRATVVETVE